MQCGETIHAVGLYRESAAPLNDSYVQEEMSMMRAPRQLFGTVALCVSLLTLL